MRLHPIALVIVIGLGLAAVGFILTILYPFITTGNFDHSRVRTAVLLPSVYVGFTLAFGCKAVIATRLLKHIFAAK